MSREPVERKPRYYAYLLRCWETGASREAAGSAWRFSLEDPHTGKRRNFAGLEALIAALRADLAGDGEAGACEAGARGVPDRDG